MLSPWYPLAVYVLKKFDEQYLKLLLVQISTLSSIFLRSTYVQVAGSSVWPVMISYTLSSQLKALPSVLSVEWKVYYAVCLRSPTVPQKIVLIRLL